MSLAFDEEKVRSTIADCPSVKFDFKTLDGEPLDPELFTQVLQTLKVYSDYPDKEGEYNLRVTAYMKSNFMTYSNSAIFDFVVKVHGED